MCEPISILGSAMTVASTAIALGQQTYDIITGIQDAPDNIKRLAIDLQGLYHVLGLLSHALSAQDQKSRQGSLPVHMIANIKELLEKCVDVFKEVSKVVQPFLDSNGNALRSFSRGLRWEIGKKASVTTLQRALSDYKLTLELAISSLNFINSSQTIDMVQLLQKDVRRLRRQVNTRDREERAQINTPVDQQEVIPNQEAYSETMRRFLVRTESVVSSTSTSTRVTDSLFSDDASDITSMTEYSEFRSSEIAIPKPFEDVVPHVNETGFNASERLLHSASSKNSLDSEMKKTEKTSTWKKFRRRMMKSGDPRSPDLESVPETDLYTPPISVTPVEEVILPRRSLQLSERPRGIEETPPLVQSHSSENLHGERVQRKALPFRTELKKTVSTPSNPFHGYQNSLRPPETVPHRAVTTPITTSSFVTRQNPYQLTGAGPRGNALNEEHYVTSPATDRDDLLSSLRRASSKSPPSPEPSASAYAKDSPSPCNGCNEGIQGEKFYKLSQNYYHTRCFRCSSCHVLFQSETSSPFLLKGDFLVCNSCAYNCQSCDQRVEDHGAQAEALSGSFGRIQCLSNAPGQMACPGLFFCHECHKSIKNLRYVRTRLGIFCLACHPQTMSESEQSRREREREKARGIPVLVG
ncbi:hypothetical protein K432DRAFT_301815 [Lepidopterella palustris CBS 459.81]|uniref:LIM zinc-binding domain-containing protein n=1 Tax=Lepidopterella palustris CBS 459.81 TaxID=1314670 RepID=A0A8E2JDE7_9PEZI|nr:hypothetical protein K432DRAFT_301815 [Lepidopterella palustris CBS 459.81]